MTRRAIVLSELAALEEISYASSRGGWWLPFHVRYFRSQSPLHEAGVTFEGTKNILRALQRDGLCERRMDGRQYLYRINDKGLAVLEREKERTT